ncbi:hypothetical protein A2524_00415 [Candidatus Wolfebacteria bacterium RIFOXYD12_FULL_48_21]|uniref:DNA polymerase IV n=1 Tax=Candidatus Wolfebacteria bacterium RIFOXYD1_FULL_48_65 TaxID=1802561 RepID=A0A1F8E1B5_9BACT|nr:MAG: hypothetical protein A2610_01420 [Candidatus Wolfebacteria bacterium RIFOXYD1_FULL_48_65]OGM94904.1 MAG: hypothetical protein A2524_00415 [Candidatus Wolfebacteria bacterium RIFOXYD12_FULL_48_21]
MKIIAHMDMDAFFASIEERDKPWLHGLPIVIGSDPQDGKGRGVVSTANYKAREYGIRSALPISTAWRLSEAAKKQGKPGATFITPNMEKYAGASERIMAIVRRHADHIEQASVDEAYIDLTHAGGYEQAEKICRAIKKEIIQKESLTASIGIGPNKLVAKIASDFNKPDGLTVVRETDAESFLEKNKLRKIPGIGPKTEQILAAHGITTIAELKRYTQQDLHKLLGKYGLDLYEKARGRDDTELVEEWTAKSISEQETLQQDTLAGDVIIALLKKLAKQVHGRFETEGFTAFKTVSITVRFEGFETKTRAKTLPAPTADIAVFEFEALKLLLPFLDQRENPHRKAIRLIGVKMEKLQ